MLKSLGNYEFKEIKNEDTRISIQNLDKKINEAYCTMCRCKSQAHNLSESWKGLKADRESMSFATQIQGGAIFESFQVAMDKIKKEYNDAKDVYSKAIEAKTKLLREQEEETQLEETKETLSQIHYASINNACQYYIETGKLDAIDLYVKTINDQVQLEDDWNELISVLDGEIWEDDDTSKLEKIFQDRFEELN